MGGDNVKGEEGISKKEEGGSKVNVRIKLLE